MPVRLEKPLQQQQLRKREEKIHFVLFLFFNERGMEREPLSLSAR